jgi:hypothetical protein
MSVSLTPKLEHIVQDKATSHRVRSQIDEGWESLRRGEIVDGEAFFGELARRERALAQRKK